MLLDMGNHLSSETSGKNVNKLLAALAVATRETDIPGWYENDRIVGVMFTEICFDDRETIVSTMIARLSDILRNNLSLEQFNRVSISFHVFPEDWDQDSRKPSNPVLYPDLSKQADKKRASGALKRAMDIVGSSLSFAVGCSNVPSHRDCRESYVKGSCILPSTAARPTRRTIHVSEVPLYEGWATIPVFTRNTSRS